VKSLSARRDYRTLRNEGITVPKTIDGLIATFCIANHHTLLHSDRDYDGFERYLGLRVISNGTPAP
jgi:predicted nucleic acid-binding protein